MKSNLKFLNKSKYLPIDKFFQEILYNKKYGYYYTKQPFGFEGDFVTSPKISSLFSEMIAIWIISTWENFGKPKKINIIELGPGDGSLIKVLINVFKRFPEFNSAKKIYLLEVSNFLKKIQKKNINSNEVQWINNLDKIKKGPVIFFGNEFFDAIPIKQFKRKNKLLLEKYYSIQKDMTIKENFVIASKQDKKIINSYKTLKKLKFIEFPKIGFSELKKFTKKILNLKGCILLIDYGYIKPNNRNTLQSVIKHTKNPLLENLGKADISSLVNFSLLKEFFAKNKLKTKAIISQKDFLENMGINKRAEIIAKNMRFNEQANLYLRLKRLLNPNYMGRLFKVLLAYNQKTNYFGFK